MLAGRSLNCLINPSQGSAPPAGVYQIQPPMDDVVFGQLAVMTQVGGPAGGGASAQSEFKWLGDESWVGNKKYVGASVSHFEKFVGPGGGTASGSYEFSGASASIFEKMVGPGRGAASFVLSSRPIPGRNCLVIQSNFDDLMDALKNTGGAMVRFA
jgi:hypothetical protein